VNEPWGVRGGLVVKAHRLLYHSTLGLRLIKKKKKKGGRTLGCAMGENFSIGTAFCGSGFRV